MEIIKRGIKKEDREVITTCRDCGCEFKFAAREAKFTFDQRDGDFYTVLCPQCNNPCHVASSRFSNNSF